MARWDENEVPLLEDKVAVITGANSGLGLETAQILARKGAKIVLACRNIEKAEYAAKQVESVGSGGAEIVGLDLASMDSIKAAAKEIRARFHRVDLLINNAGLMGIDKAQTQDGFEMQFGVNHLGHFVFTAELMPVVLATPGSRIVNVSSMGHRMGRLVTDDLMFKKRRYDRWRPYFQSKLANLLFTAELSRRLKEAGWETMALAAHPGASNTDLGHEGGGITNIGIRMGSRFAQPAWLGALATVRAASDPGAKSGQFYGPQFLALGYPTLETPSRRARNSDDARHLWNISESLTDVVFELPDPD